MKVVIHSSLKDLDSQKDCVRKRGHIRAKIIFRRLDQLKAALSLEDMRSLPGNCHELKNNRKGQLAVDLDGPYRLIFRPVAAKELIHENASLVWSKVTEIEVIGIEDYHE
jgi:proteic killer suppression protein